MVQVIEKEKVQYQTFKQVQSTNQQHLSVIKNLIHRATILGNGFKNKAKIVFNTIEGEKEVETTIWEASDAGISLKGGAFIPISAIKDVIL
jgi:hypothetical protein